MITVVVKMPGQDPEVRRIDGTVKAIQKVTGGYFEVHTFIGGTTLYCNDDALHKYMAPNVVDVCHPVIIVGTVLVMAGDNGLSRAQVPKVISELKHRTVAASAL